MIALRPSVSFFAGTTCGIVAAILLFYFNRTRPDNWLRAAAAGYNRYENVSPTRDLLDGRRLDEEDAFDGDMARSGRKIFVDCGANTASSVELFLDTYPDAEEYEIFSFEIDPSLRPYFADISSRHRLFCPAAVSDDSRNSTAFLQGSWSPQDRLQDGKEMHWGGGTLHPYFDEKSSVGGGQRNLVVKVNVPAINLQDWILRSFTTDDYVILKLDIEGSEYGVLSSILSSGAYHLVDKLYGEIHEWAPNGVTKAQWRELKSLMARKNLKMLSWEAESLNYADMEYLNYPLERPPSAAGQPGELLSSCRGAPSGRKSIGLSVAVGMNPLPAERLVAIIESFFHLYRIGDFNDAGKRSSSASLTSSSSTAASLSSSSISSPVAHRTGSDLPSPKDSKIASVVDDDAVDESTGHQLWPLTIFVYSDFVKLYPDLVKRWSEVFEIGSRGQRPRPRSPRVQVASYRKSLVSAKRMFRRHRLEPNLLLSDAWRVSTVLLNQARRSGLSVIRPTVAFPPFYGDSLSDLGELYYLVRSVERTPKALRFINDGLKVDGGILTLDGDHDDSRLISVFLLEFIRNSANFDLVRLNRCF